MVTAAVDRVAGVGMEGVALELVVMTATAVPALRVCFLVQFESSNTNPTLF